MGPDSGLAIRVFLTEQFHIMDRITRTEDDRLIQVPNRSDENRSCDGNYSNAKRTWRNNGIFFLFAIRTRTELFTFLQGNPFRQPQSTQPRNSPFRKAESNPNTSSSSYGQKLPQSNSEPSTKVVHFTTTDECIIEFLVFCPLNC